MMGVLEFLDGLSKVQAVVLGLVLGSLYYGLYECKEYNCKIVSSIAFVLVSLYLIRVRNDPVFVGALAFFLAWHGGHLFVELRRYLNK